MSDLLTRLAGRALGAAPVVQPLLTSRFEPGPDVLGPAPDPLTRFDDDTSQAPPPPGPLPDTTSPGLAARAAFPAATELGELGMPAGAEPPVLEDGGRRRYPPERDEGRAGVGGADAPFRSFDVAEPALPADGPSTDATRPLRGRTVPQQLPEPGSIDRQRPTGQPASPERTRPGSLPGASPATEGLAGLSPEDRAGGDQPGEARQSRPDRERLTTVERQAQAAAGATPARGEGTAAGVPEPASFALDDEMSGARWGRVAPSAQRSSPGAAPSDFLSDEVADLGARAPRPRPPEGGTTSGTAALPGGRAPDAAAHEMQSEAPGGAGETPPARSAPPGSSLPAAAPAPAPAFAVPGLTDALEADDLARAGRAGASEAGSDAAGPAARADGGSALLAEPAGRAAGAAAARPGATAPRGYGGQLTGGSEASAAAAPPAAPTIHVTIGRIEVRAVAPAAPPAPPTRAAPSRRALSLDEYLAQRNGARR
ncbi:MAG: hypothetical protein ACRDJN_09150 [Chloroflexota bacterium]